MNIYSDEISGQYQKYIVKLILKDGRKCYILWGTDMQHEDNDYLLLNKKEAIVAFTKIEDISAYIKSHQVTVDPANTYAWAQHHKNNKAYCTYNLAEIKNRILDDTFSLALINKEDATALLNFYNLFADFACQINDERYLKLMHDNSLKIFFDFFYDSFFWSNATGAKSPDKNFNKEQFLSKYLEVIDLFEERLAHNE